MRAPVISCSGAGGCALWEKKDNGGDAGRGRAGARSGIIEPQNPLEGVWTLCSKGKGKPPIVLKPGSDAA